MAQRGRGARLKQRGVERVRSATARHGHEVGAAKLAESLADITSGLAIKDRHLVNAVREQPARCKGEGGGGGGCYVQGS